MRATFSLGGPLDYNGVRYADKSDRRQEQRAIYRDYQLDFNSYILENFSEDDDTGFMVDLVSTIIRQESFA
jgi:hypothetical protein